MPPDWVNEDRVPYNFQSVSTRKYRGNRLAGTPMLVATSNALNITLQEWQRPLYHAAFRIFNFFRRQSPGVREREQCLRLEAVLNGELVTENMAGERTKLRAGHYQLTREEQFLIHGKKGRDCHYFVSYYPHELIKEFGIDNFKFTPGPLPIPEQMAKVIHEALHNPYDASLHELYYQTLLRDLFFIHLTAARVELPTTLTEEDIATVYRADAFLSEDLSEHYSIEEISSKVGTNSFKLKKGFRAIFQMGVFGRLLSKRMEYAKLLLETTLKPIKEIALETGYETVAGFITAFRKRYGMTPLDWREEKTGYLRQSENDEEEG